MPRTPMPCSHAELRIAARRLSPAAYSHETICAAIQEQLASTYLQGPAVNAPHAHFRDSDLPRRVSGVTADDTARATEHLSEGIAILRGLLARRKEVCLSYVHPFLHVRAWMSKRQQGQPFICMMHA
jgi:hypothetical protein